MTARTMGLTIAAIACAALIATPQAAKLQIGEVVRTQAEVSGDLSGQRRQLQPDLPIYRNETVRTGNNARAGLQFTDGSTLNISADAQVLLDKFVFDSDGDGTIALLKGALRFTSGKSGQKALRIKTPVATIGIRGTDFWVGEIDGAIGVLLLSGEVEVSNDGGSVTLDEPLQGTLITAVDRAPNDPSVWPGDRRARALASVTFN